MFGIKEVFDDKNPGFALVPPLVGHDLEKVIHTWGCPQFPVVGNGSDAVMTPLSESALATTVAAFATIALREQPQS